MPRNTQARADNEIFRFYNSLVLPDDIAHFRKAPMKTQYIYALNATSDDGEPPLQTRTHD
jgi:hypothetical protein